MHSPLRSAVETKPRIAGLASKTEPCHYRRLSFCNVAQVKSKSRIKLPAANSAISTAVLGFYISRFNVINATIYIRKGKFVPTGLTSNVTFILMPGGDFSGKDRDSKAFFHQY